MRMHMDAHIIIVIVWLSRCMDIQLCSYVLIVITSTLTTNTQLCLLVSVGFNTYDV